MDTEHRINGERTIAELESVLAQAEAMQKRYRENAERRNQLLRMLRACYNKALKDTDTRLPTYLHAALENVMALIPEQPGTVDPVFSNTLAVMAGQVGP